MIRKMHRKLLYALAAAVVLTGLLGAPSFVEPTFADCPPTGNPVCDG